MADHSKVESLEPWLVDCLLAVSSCVLEVNDDLAIAAEGTYSETRSGKSGSCM